MGKTLWSMLSPQDLFLPCSSEPIRDDIYQQYAYDNREIKYIFVKRLEHTANNTVPHQTPSLASQLFIRSNFH